MLVMVRRLSDLLPSPVPRCEIAKKHRANQYNKIEADNVVLFLQSVLEAYSY